MDFLRLDADFMRQVTAWERLPARAAQWAAFPAELHPALPAALRANGVNALYTHQAQTVQAALHGQHVMQVTGTASGKTLGYTLPTLHTLLHDPQARALWLFPTKALAQDQAETVTRWLAHLPDLTRAQVAAHLYDGDTSTNQRTAARHGRGILLSNPDMLHLGLLPHHPRWADWFGNLRYVVLDEAHTYRGLFGSHVANVVRRLRRVCAFYGAYPQFLLASATLANPRSWAQALLEIPVTLVEDDGAPRAEKHVVVYNPPTLNGATGARRPYVLAARDVALRLWQAAMPTVLFARTRHATELALSYWRDAITTLAGDPASVRGYRGGYLASERREIERALRTGAARGVVATNALELGVDIGSLQAAVLAGYPGTLASFWQQVGRVGRRTATSLAVLVASAAPLDQYLAQHPRFLFERSVEHALINPDNLALAAAHLRCAVFELPLSETETLGGFADTQAVLDALSEEGDMVRAGGAFRWVGTAYPAQGISLRTVNDDRVLIQDDSGPRPYILGDVDYVTAPQRVHPGAVYGHEGRTFVITALDDERRLAHAQPHDDDYFTQAQEDVQARRVAVHAEHAHARPARAWGLAQLTAQTVSFSRVRRYTHEVLDITPLDWPPRQWLTTACWLWFPPALVEELKQHGVNLGPNDYGPEWPLARAAARARDGYRCARCGRPETPDREHDVHHLRPLRAFDPTPAGRAQAHALSNLQTLCRACHTREEAARGVQTALGGLAHVLGHVAPWLLMCDTRDLGVLAQPTTPDWNAPALVLFDRAPGGLGLAETLFQQTEAVLRHAHDLVRDCPCEAGCPACVGPVSAPADYTKAHTLKVLEVVS